jgi:hypothetical protein
MSFKCIAHLIIHQWDTGGEKVKLPKRMKVEIYPEGVNSIDNIHELAIEKASDMTGWCILGCSLTRIDLQ